MIQARRTTEILGGFAELAFHDAGLLVSQKRLSVHPLLRGKASLYLERSVMDTAFVNGQWVGASAQ